MLSAKFLGITIAIVLIITENPEFENFIFY